MFGAGGMLGGMGVGGLGFGSGSVVGGDAALGTSALYLIRYERRDESTGSGAVRS